MISSKRWPLRAHSRGSAGQIGEDWSGAFWPTPTDTPVSEETWAAKND
jgi:hypothetical protein